MIKVKHQQLKTSANMQLIAICLTVFLPTLSVSLAYNTIIPDTNAFKFCYPPPPPATKCNSSDVFGIFGNQSKARIPCLVGILARISWSSDDTLCEGALITPAHVLTTASCFTNTDRGTVRVFMGTRNSRAPNITVENPQSLYIDKGIDYIIHPQYNKDTQANNIAVVRLPYNVTLKPGMIETIRIDKTVVGVDENCNLTGYGILHDSSTSTGGVRVVNSSNVLTMTTIKVEKCNEYFGNDNNVGNKTNPGSIRNDLLCTECLNRVQKKAIGEVCQSTRGAPLVCYTTTRIRFLAGLLHAIGTPGCQQNYPVTFIRLSSYIPWLIQNVPNVMGTLAETGFSTLFPEPTTSRSIFG